MRKEKLDQLAERMSKEITESLGGFMPKVPRGFLDMELGPPHIHTLEIISRCKKPPKISEIGRRLSISFAMMTHIIDRLESKELLRRESDAKDRRIIRIKLNRKGKALIERMKNFHKRHILNMLSKFEEKDRKEFVEAMDTILNILLKYRRG
jgi:DNA-binding MarR family transcriptional regulator